MWEVSSSPWDMGKICPIRLHWAAVAPIWLTTVSYTNATTSLSDVQGRPEKHLSTVLHESSAGLASPDIPHGEEQ